MKDIFASLIDGVEKKDKFIDATLPYLREQVQDLMKIGVVIDKGHNINGKIKNDNIKLSIKNDIPTIIILDKYMIAGAKITDLITHKEIKTNINNINSILKEMQTFTKRYCNINIKKKY